MPSPVCQPVLHEKFGLSLQGAEKERSEGRELLDWTRKGPLPEIPSRRGPEKSTLGTRGAEYSPDLGSDRPRRPAFEQGDGKPRDFSNWERRGPLTPTMPSAPGARPSDRPASHDGPRDRKASPAWGEGRSQDGSRPPRRDFAERPVPERAPTAAELDTQWRSKMRPDPPAASAQVPSGKGTQPPPSPATAVPPFATRPKLNLQKRTVSQAEASPALPTGSSEVKASPFGTARPIDTSAREKEIEEKIKQRREVEEKAREDKRATEEKKVTEDRAKEKRSVKEPDRSEQRPEKAKTRPNGHSKEEDQREQQAEKTYQILRRDAGDTESENTEKDHPNFSMEAAEDTHVKPQAVVRDIDTVASASTSAEPLQEEGWSTVSKPSKSRRGGNAGARAIAS